MPKRYTGRGKANTGNHESHVVDYLVEVDFHKSTQEVSRLVKAQVVGPQNAIDALASKLNTLVLKDGEEIQGLFSNDGNISIFNPNNDIRGFAP